jgi:hypothetical protein
LGAERGLLSLPWGDVSGEGGHFGAKQQTINDLNIS